MSRSPLIILVMQEWLREHPGRVRVPAYELEAALDGYADDIDETIHDAMDRGIIERSNYRGPGYRIA